MWRRGVHRYLYNFKYFPSVQLKNRSVWLALRSTCLALSYRSETAECMQ